MRDKAGERAPCLHACTFDGQRTSSGSAARCVIRPERVHAGAHGSAPRFKRRAGAAVRQPHSCARRHRTHVARVLLNTERGSGVLGKTRCARFPVLVLAVCLPTAASLLRTSKLGAHPAAPAVVRLQGVFMAGVRAHPRGPGSCPPVRGIQGRKQGKPRGPGGCPLARGIQDRNQSASPAVSAVFFPQRAFKAGIRAHTPWPRRL